MSKILVTGSAGFIGFHLSKSLLDDGYEVLGIDNVNDYYNPQLKLDRLSLLKKYKILILKRLTYQIGYHLLNRLNHLALKR